MSNETNNMEVMMQVTINPDFLGKGQLYDHCTELHCALGRICEAAGVEDDEMNHRKSIVFKRIEAVKNAEGTVVKAEVPAKDLPEELIPFFVEQDWNPISYEGARKFVPTDLGESIIRISDVRSKSWQEQFTSKLAEENVEVVWEQDTDVG